MAGAASRLGFKLVAAAVAIPVGRAVTKATTAAWVKARPEAGNVNPKDVDVNWTDALIWAGLTGIGAAVAQLITTKGADTVWRALTGTPSPRPKHAEEQPA
ncbi:MAG TPA: DUF4235 domain-containing protein [Jatrophihabitans sp.]|nr:DUF4235 domain-containing protein [Jatrophihabitans sp.]